MAEDIVVAGVMPEAEPFFARLLAFELACPGCSRVSALPAGVPRSFWEPRTATFTCPGCRRAFTLGIVAWRGAQRATRASHEPPVVPPDTVPTEAEARGLREARAENGLLKRYLAGLSRAGAPLTGHWLRRAVLAWDRRRANLQLVANIGVAPGLLETRLDELGKAARKLKLIEELRRKVEEGPEGG